MSTPRIARRRAIVLVLLAQIVLAGCTGERPATIERLGPETRTVPIDAPGSDGLATVREIVDGDTIVVERHDRRETIRLLGIDTPETVDRSKPIECFGPEASNRLAELLPSGTEVRLLRDDELVDRFDRVLAYVFRLRDHEFINLAMVIEGYARTLAISPNTSFTTLFEQAQAQARSQREGVWSCP